ncbi:MAG: hypothetical protein RL885_12990 [Planctomycetota bacterium]
MDLNTALRVNPDPDPNRDIVDLTEGFGRRDNASFLAEVARGLREASKIEGANGTRIDPGGVGCIGLMGEYGFVGHACRQAQAVLGLDRRPSFWSHAFLLVDPLSIEDIDNRSSARSAVIWESSLTPPPGRDWLTWRNGVNPRRIGEYSRKNFDPSAPHSVPNFAILAIGLTDAEREALLQRASNADLDQLRYDLSGMRGSWLRYLSRRSGIPNPLAEGEAFPAAAYVQFAYDAANIDLTPGAHQRNTAPEHIWAAAQYLRDTFRTEIADSGEPAPRPLKAWYCVRDRTCAMAPEDAGTPTGLDDLLERGTTK